MPPDINSYLVEDGDRFGAHGIGPCSRALYFEIFSGIVSQQSFGHLACCRVASPENQHSFFLRVLLWGHKVLPIERPVKDTVSSEPPTHAPEQLLGIEEPALRVFSSPLHCFAFCTSTRAVENRPPM